MSKAFEVSDRMRYRRRRFQYDPENTAAPLTLIYENMMDRSTDTFSISNEDLLDLYKRRISKEGFDVALLKKFLGREVKDQATIKYDHDGQVKIGTKSFLSLEAMNKNEQSETKQRKQFQKQTSLLLLKDQEKTALIAFQAINFIQRAKQDEILKNTKESFRQQIINHLLKKFGSQDGSYDNPLKRILRLFQIQYNKDQAKQNAAVMLYDRFKEAAIRGNQIIFNPTFLTSEIFQSAFKGRDSILITGNGGLGKSISLWLLARLASFINKIKIHQNIDKCRNFIPLLGEQYTQFLQFPKIYYITLSNDSCFGNIVESIKKQTDFKIQSNNLTEILQQIESEAEYEIQIYFIVDQINIYSSIVRRHLLQQNYQKQQQKKAQKSQLLQYTKFLKDLKKKFKIIYSSSVNLQKGLIRKSRSDSIFNFFQLEKKRKIQENIVGNYRINPSNHFRIEIIHSVLFEISIRLASRVQHENIKTLKKIFAQAFQNWSIHQSEVFESIREINPLIVRYFFTQKHNIIKYKHIQSQGKSMNPFAKFEHVENLLSEIIEYQRNILKNDYQTFLLKGSKQLQIKKFKVFIALKQKAKERCEDYWGQKPSFRVFFNNNNQLCAQLELDMINQNHTNVDLSDQFIEIFYSPKAFLQIVRDVEQPMSSFLQLLRQSFQQDQMHPGFLSVCLDKYFAQPIAQREINLIFEEQIIHLKGGKNNYFVHLNKGKKTLNASLNNLITKLEQSKLEAIGALPIYTFKILHSINPYISRAIDSLILIKNINSRYKFKLITFDFVILQSEKELKRKFQKAVDFFIDLSQRVNTQDKYPFEAFQIEHYIVAEEKVYKRIQVETKQPLSNVKIDWTPIRLFWLQLMQKKQQDLFSQKLEYIYAVLRQRADQQ